MPQVTVHLASVLARVIQGTDRVQVEASSVGKALDALLEAYPALRVHLMDESGELREHVLCFHNDINTRWLKDLSAATREGDTLTIFQAVSGG